MKYYPRPPCAPSLIKSRFFSHTTIYLLTYIFTFLKFLICIHAGNPRVPPRDLASGPKPCGGNNVAHIELSLATLANLQLFTHATSFAIFSSFWSQATVNVPLLVFSGTFQELYCYFWLRGKRVENTSLSLLIISNWSLHNFWNFPRYANHCCTGHAIMSTEHGNDQLITASKVGDPR